MVGGAVGISLDGRVVIGRDKGGVPVQYCYQIKKKVFVITREQVLPSEWFMFVYANRCPHVYNDVSLCTNCNMGRGPIEHYRRNSLVRDVLTFLANKLRCIHRHKWIKQYYNNREHDVCSACGLPREWEWIVSTEW